MRHRTHVEIEGELPGAGFPSPIPWTLGLRLRSAKPSHLTSLVIFMYVLFYDLDKDQKKKKKLVWLGFYP